MTQVNSLELLHRKGALEEFWQKIDLINATPLLQVVRKQCLASV